MVVRSVVYNYNNNIMVPLIRIRKNRLEGYRDIDGRFQLQRNDRIMIDQYNTSS